MKRLTTRMPLLPVTLRGRLTVTIILGGTLLFVMVFGVTSIVNIRQAQNLTEADAVAHLDTLNQLLHLNARELDSFLVSYAEWDEFYQQTLDPDPEFIAEEFDPWLREQTGATLVLWTGPDGRSVSEFGDPADVAAVRDLLETHGSDALGGPVGLPGGPSVVAVRSIVGDPPARPVGYLVIARPIAPVILASRTPRHITQVRVSASAAGSTSDWFSLPQPEGYDFVVSRFENRQDLRVKAAISGLNGSTAGFIEFLDLDPWSEAAGLDPYLVALSLGLASLLLGLAFGTVLATLIRSPIEHFVSYIRDQGYLAIEGLPFEEHLEIDPNLPNDFKNLGGVIQDVLIQLRIRQSELKRANEQTLAAEQAFRTVVNDSSEAKLLVVDGVVDIANPAAAECLGMPIGMLVKRPLAEIFKAVSMTLESGEALDIDRLISSALKRPVTVRCEVGNQGERWMLVMVSAASTEGSYLLTARNVSEEHHLEELRAEIVSLVSHDLRAPLTVISGYLDLLERPLPEENHTKAVSEMRAAAARMTALLENLLDTARTERALAPARFEEVDLGALADQVAEATSVATHREIKVRKQAGALVLGDADRLRQALDNLVGNAC
ncbi:MAG: CHASE4 domain-containing protein, partial [Coriobacteriia bacterium]